MEKMTVRVNTWNDDALKVNGVKSESGMFCAGASARYNPKLEWTPSQRTAGTDTRTLMRIDATISAVKDGEQSEDVFPYISCRLMQIRGSFGQRIRMMTPFDNEANRQFKNLSIAADMFNALKGALKEAIDDAKARAKRGEGAPVSATSEYIDDSAEFISLAEQIAASVPQAQSTSQKAADQNIANDSAQVAQEALGGSSSDQ